MTWFWPSATHSPNQIYALGERLRAELVRFLPDGGFTTFLNGIPALELDYSRDGNQLVYTKFPDFTLWVSRPDGSNARQLTDAAIESRQPHFAPDGKSIAFMGHRPNDLWRIFSISVKGGTPEPLVVDKEDQGVPTWSEDGKFLVYGERLTSKARSAMALHVVDVGKRTVTILPGSQGLWTARWSPDGRYIAALTTDSKSLMLLDVRSNSWRKLGDFRYFENPIWTFEGDYILGQDGAHLYRVQVKSGLAEELADLKGFDVARDGWIGVTPKGIPIALHGITLEDIYALDCDFP
jgi:Tol biopolymer transport system component